MPASKNGRRFEIKSECRPCQADALIVCATISSPGIALQGQFLFVNEQSIMVLSPESILNIEKPDAEKVTKPGASISESLLLHEATTPAYTIRRPILTVASAY